MISPGTLDFKHYLGKRVQLGVTGCVAAYKAYELLRMILGSGASAGVSLSAAAQKFVTPLSFAALGADPVYGALFEPGQDPFAHLSPGQCADCLVVAPATANCLAKLACGLADDMLSTQALAFAGPLLLAPAMNPRMWAAAATRENWLKLLERGVVGIEPEYGPVACGELGQGRLANPEEIFAQVLRALSPKDMAGQKVLVTLGPTREPFDAARYWSNPSSGLMGGALAVAAWLRGARVKVVAGPCEVWLPKDVEVTRVTTAKEMHAACLDLWPAQDIGCLTAAVSDFSPLPHGPHKFKKTSLPEGNLCLPFSLNPDILLELGQNKSASQKLVGFCAETQELLANAKDKLERKNLDLVVANNITRPESGFVSPTNQVLVLDAKGRQEEWPCLAKTEVAWRIWEWLENL